MSRVSDSPSAWEIGPPRLPQETTAIRALARAYDLLATWPRRPDYLDHLLEAGRVAVARGPVGIVGYGGAFVGPRQTHLTDLFVHAVETGRGVGGAILTALELDPAKTSTFASADPRAQTLYRRLGLRTLDQLSYLVGGAEEVERLRRRLERRTVSPGADTEQAIEKHLAMRGGLHGAATMSFLVETARPVIWESGYAWLRIATDRVCVGPMGSHDPTTAASVVCDALLEATRQRPTVQLFVAHSHPAHAALIESGFTTNDVDIFMAGDRSLIDLARYCPDPDLG